MCRTASNGSMATASRSLVRWAVRIDAIERRTAPNHRLADRLIASAEAADHRLDRLLGVPAPGQGTAGP